MEFDIAVNRVGGFVGVAHDGPSKNADFKTLLEFATDAVQSIQKNGNFENAYAEMSRLIPGRPRFQRKPDDNAHFEFPIARATNERDDMHLIGRLPSREVICELDDAAFLLSARATFTACAVKGDTDTKLWWTFHAIPVSDWSKLTSHQRRASIADIVALTDRIGDNAMYELFKAFRQSFANRLQISEKHIALSNDRVRIALADNDGYDFSELVNELAIRSRNIADVHKDSFIRDGRSPAFRGLAELRQFVSRVRGAPLWDNEMIQYKHKKGECGGVYLLTRRKTGNENDSTMGNEVRVLGFAQKYRAKTIRSPAFVWGEENKDWLVDHVLASSASRPMTAALAHILAEEASNQRQNLLEAPEL